jgi:NAD(P)-dependent dehydrogenase (short-subunit alcohol dehydrogenase family)
MTPIRFDDRVVLVTGGGRGLGAAYARAFAERGASVIVHDAGVALDGTGGDARVADAVVEEIRRGGGTAVACAEDLVSPTRCARGVELAAERFGRLDVVVHNAGLLVFETFEEADRSWERVRQVTVDAPFQITRAAIPLMKREGYGRFVFTTSGRAMWPKDALAGMAAYAVGKMAAFGLMLVTGTEGQQHDICANAISPVAATRMLQRRAEPGELDAELVVPGVLFLASDRCMFSGVVLQAAGGKFSTVQWQRGDVVDFGRDPVEPEAIAARWHDIEGAARAA